MNPVDAAYKRLAAAEKALVAGAVTPEILQEIRDAYIAYVEARCKLPQKEHAVRKEWKGFRIGPFWLHRLEQWDKDDYIPFLCIHFKTPNRTKRIFLL